MNIWRPLASDLESSKGEMRYVVSIIFQDGKALMPGLGYSIETTFKSTLGAGISGEEIFANDAVLEAVLTSEEYEKNRWMIEDMKEWSSIVQKYDEYKKAKSLRKSSLPENPIENPKVREQIRDRLQMNKRLRDIYESFKSHQRIIKSRQNRQGYLAQVLRLTIAAAGVSAAILLGPAAFLSLTSTVFSGAVSMGFSAISGIFVNLLGFISSLATGLSASPLSAILGIVGVSAVGGKAVTGLKSAFSWTVGKVKDFFYENIDKPMAEFVQKTLNTQEDNLVQKIDEIREKKLTDFSEKDLDFDNFLNWNSVIITQGISSLTAKGFGGPYVAALLFKVQQMIEGTVGSFSAGFVTHNILSFASRVAKLASPALKIAYEKICDIAAIMGGAFWTQTPVREMYSNEQLNKIRQERQLGNVTDQEALAKELRSEVLDFKISFIKRYTPKTYFFNYENDAFRIDETAIQESFEKLNKTPIKKRAFPMMFEILNSAIDLARYLKDVQDAIYTDSNEGIESFLTSLVRRLTELNITVLLLEKEVNHVLKGRMAIRRQFAKLSTVVNIPLSERLKTAVGYKSHDELISKINRLLSFYHSIVSPELADVDSSPDSSDEPQEKLLSKKSPHSSVKSSVDVLEYQDKPEGVRVLCLQLLLILIIRYTLENPTSGKHDALITVLIQITCLMNYKVTKKIYDSRGIEKEFTHDNAEMPELRDGDNVLSKYRLEANFRELLPERVTQELYRVSVKDEYNMIQALKKLYKYRERIEEKDNSGTVKKVTYNYVIQEINQKYSIYNEEKSDSSIAYKKMAELLNLNKSFLYLEEASLYLKLSGVSGRLDSLWSLKAFKNHTSKWFRNRAYSYIGYVDTALANYDACREKLDKVPREERIYSKKRIKICFLKFILFLVAVEKAHSTRLSFSSGQKDALDIQLLRRLNNAIGDEDSSVLEYRNVLQDEEITPEKAGHYSSLITRQDPICIFAAQIMERISLKSREFKADRAKFEERDPLAEILDSPHAFDVGAHLRTIDIKVLMFIIEKFPDIKEIMIDILSQFGAEYHKVSDIREKLDSAFIQSNLPQFFTSIAVKDVSDGAEGVHDTQFGAIFRKEFDTKKKVLRLLVNKDARKARIAEKNKLLRKGRARLSTEEGFRLFGKKVYAGPKMNRFYYVAKGSDAEESDGIFRERDRALKDAGVDSPVAKLKDGDLSMLLRWSDDIAMTFSHNNIIDILYALDALYEKIYLMTFEDGFPEDFSKAIDTHGVIQDRYKTREIKTLESFIFSHTMLKTVIKLTQELLMTQGVVSRDGLELLDISLKKEKFQDLYLKGMKELGCSHEVSLDDANLTQYSRHTLTQVKSKLETFDNVSHLTLTDKDCLETLKVYISIAFANGIGLSLFKSLSLVFNIFDSVLKHDKGSHDALLRKVRLLTGSLELSGDLRSKLEELQACYDSLSHESSPLNKVNSNLVLRDSKVQTLSPLFLDKVFQNGFNIIEDAHKKGVGLRPVIDNPWQYALYVIAGIQDADLRQKTFDYIKSAASDNASKLITPYEWIRGELAREAI